MKDVYVTAKEQKMGAVAILLIALVILGLIAIIIWLAVRNSKASEVADEDVDGVKPAPPTPPPTTPPTAGGGSTLKPAQTTIRYSCLDWGSDKFPSACNWGHDGVITNRCMTDICTEQVAKQECDKWGVWEIQLDKTKPPTCLGYKTHFMPPALVTPTPAPAPAPEPTPPPPPPPPTGCTWTPFNHTTNKATALGTAGCTEAIAKSECEGKLSSTWVPVDTSTNPFTCKQIFKNAGESCAAGTECVSGKCEGGFCVNVKCGIDPVTGYTLRSCAAGRCCSGFGWCGAGAEFCTQSSNSSWNGEF